MEALVVDIMPLMARENIRLTHELGTVTKKVDRLASELFDANTMIMILKAELKDVKLNLEMKTNEFRELESKSREQSEKDKNTLEQLLIQGAQITQDTSEIKSALDTLQHNRLLCIFR